MARCRLMAVLSIVLAALLTALGSAACAAEEAPAPAPVPGTALLALRNGDVYAASHPGRYSTIVLNAWEAPRIPALKAANPNVKVLVYKDMSSTRSYAVRDGVDEALLPTGVGHAAAEATNPQWFLTDTTGARIEWAGYSGHWWMDVGDQSYIDTWVANVSDELRRSGWDGVMIDNAMTSPVYLRSGQRLAKYPDTPSYQAATERFLASAGPRLQGSGFAVVPNFGGNVPSMELYRRWVGYGTGALREFWGRWGFDGSMAIHTDANWAHAVDQMETAQRAGKTFLAVSYGSTTDSDYMRYARATFLLAWDGGASSLAYTPSAAAKDPWSPEWTTDLGRPAEAKRAVGSAWTRRYERGIVAVNPSSATPAVVALGADYRDAAGAVTSTVTLAPGSAAMLRKLDGPSAAPAVAPAAPTTTTTAAPVADPAPPTIPTSTTTAATPIAPAPVPASAPTFTTASASAPATAPSTTGYWVLGSDGGVFSYGRAPFWGSVPGLGIRTTTVTMAATPGGGGYWMLGADGGIFTFGDAGFHGSVPGLGLGAPVNAIDLQATPSGNGYWVLGADGGIFTFGDAGFHGSLPGLGIRNRAVKLVPTPSGRGYWVLGADGGVFTFGDAGFYGSVPGLGIRNTSVTLAATPSGKGYWLLGADGGVFTFGDAAFHGSVPGLAVRTPGVQLRPTADGGGYYVLGDDGAVFAFGNAPDLGSPRALGIRGQDLAVL